MLVAHKKFNFLLNFKNSENKICTKLPRQPPGPFVFRSGRGNTNAFT